MDKTSLKIPPKGGGGGVIRSRKSEKDRQHNDYKGQKVQTMMHKRLQNTNPTKNRYLI